MAYYNQTTTLNSSLIERALESTATMLNAASLRYARYRVFRQTYKELAQLSDRELADLGMSAYSIRGVAWDAAENHTGS